ncbi:MAG: hypothetical protein HY608_06470 [Planctomycetes bacterium]|nr:hypothetical protein [Planctomycetota bacterium]
MRRAMAAAILGLCACLGSTALAGTDFTGQAPPEITVAEWINSDPATLASLRGGVVLLEFWGTH